MIRAFMFAVVLMVSAPALAAETDMQIAEGLTHCAVFMEEVAVAAEKEGAMDDVKQSRDTGAAYQMASMMYMPQEMDDNAVRAQSETWASAAKTNMPNTFSNEASFNAAVTKCSNYGDEVQAVIDMLKQAQPQS